MVSLENPFRFSPTWLIPVGRGRICLRSTGTERYRVAPALTPPMKGVFVNRAKLVNCRGAAENRPVANMDVAT